MTYVTYVYITQYGGYPVIILPFREQIWATEQTRSHFLLSHISFNGISEVDIWIASFFPKLFPSYTQAYTPLGWQLLHKALYGQLLLIASTFFRLLIIAVIAVIQSSD